MAESLKRDDVIQWKLKEEISKTNDNNNNGGINNGNDSGNTMKDNSSSETWDESWDEVETIMIKTKF